ncbi:MAG: FkbM family methyltransferase [Mariniphaga sp.]
MEKNLIIDVGMHKAEDTDFYLSKGFNVIAIDADPNLIKSAHSIYYDRINKGQLNLQNFAISDTDDEDVIFYVGKRTIWNSLKSEIANRDQNYLNTITVKTKKLSSIFESFGVPYYCKIDIEGYDEIALISLKNFVELPLFISVETECLGENEKYVDKSSLATLRALNSLGYKQFKLVDQVSLNVLNNNAKFYTESNLLIYQIFNKLNVPFGNKRRLQKKHGYKFPNGATGPFGDDITGNWMSYEQAEKCLLKHRNDYFRLKRSISYGFWCDWHAKR